MTDQGASYRGTRMLIIAATLVILIYGVNQAQSVIALVLVAGFLALIGMPPLLWLEGKHVPTTIAVIIVMVVMIALVVIVGGVVGASLSTFSEALPLYEKRLHEQLVAAKALLATKHIVITDKVLLQYLKPGTVMHLTAGLLTGVGAALSNMVLVLLTVTFILLEASNFPIKLRAALGDPERAFPQFTKFVNDIRRYMVIKTIVSLIEGIIVGLWLFILGVEYPVLWGFLAFLLHYVPNLGPIMAAIPAVLLALVQLGAGTAALAAAGYLVVGFVLGNVVEPRLMGRQLDLSTLVVFLSLMFWGSLLGPIGVVLCIPLTMGVKWGFENSANARWVPILLGSERPVGHPPPVSSNGE